MSKDTQTQNKCAYTFELNEFWGPKILEWRVKNGKMGYGRHEPLFECPNNDVREFCDRNDPWGATPVEAIRKWLDKHTKEYIELRRQIGIAKKELKKEEK